METDILRMNFQAMDPLPHSAPTQYQPTQFYAQLIHQVWTYILKLWSARNQDQGTITNHFPANMLTDHQGIYAAQDCLPPHTHHIYNYTQEELLLNPKPYIQNWIQNNQKYIQNKLKILTKQTRIKTQDIHQLFQPC